MCQKIENCKSVILPYAKTEDVFIEAPGEINTSVLYHFCKRAFDILFSLLVIIIFFIPCLVISLIIAVSSEGPVFFLQERLGKGGKPFKIIKFRTMYIDAENDGAMWTTDENDERITPVGKVLRKTRLDEMPQFLNVISGKMTLIGPRPERKVFYDEFETYIHGFSERLKVKPGLTGYAQVYGGYVIPPEEKIKYDMEYIKNQSLWLDTKIFFKTIQVVLFGEKSKGSN